MLCKLCVDLKSVQVRSMSDVNTQISLLQVEFSMHYSSVIGCMSRIKTRLASVGVSQVCSPYSIQLSCYSFVIIRISRLFENKKVNLIISCEWLLHSLLSTKVQNIWCGICIITIKLIIERLKAFYSVISSNNLCWFSVKIYLVRDLIHEFLSWCITYYDMKCSTRWRDGRISLLF